MATMTSRAMITRKAIGAVLLAMGVAAFLVARPWVMHEHVSAGRWAAIVTVGLIMCGSAAASIWQARRELVDPSGEHPVIKQARALVADGLSVGDAARKLGVSRSILIDAGIGQTPGSQQPPAHHDGQH